MPIIKHAAAPAQPATGFRVEEHTIDARAGQGIDLTANPDLLLNPTLTTRDLHTDSDRDGGWNEFRARVATGEYGPHTNLRLVLVEANGGGR